MTPKQQELDAKLGEIAQIFMFAKEVYLYTEYFHYPDTQEELDLSINSPHAVHLSFIRHLMYRTLIVELAKLFSNSQGDKYRLITFIQQFKKSGYYGNMNITEETIQDWEQSLGIHAGIIEDVLSLRDKIYAHTDPKKDEFENIDLSFQKIHILLSVAETIIKQVYNIALDTELYTESPKFDRERFGILKLLAKAEKQRQDEIFSRYRVIKNQKPNG